MTPSIQTVPGGEIYEITTHDNQIIVMFRSKNYLDIRVGLNGFRPLKVLNAKKDVLWFFQKNKDKPLEFGELVECDDEYIIAIRDKRAIAKVVRVKDLGHTTTAMLKGKVVTIGGSSLKELLDIKISAAMKLGINYWKSPEEEVILVERTRLARKAYQEALAKQEAEKAQARAKSEAKKAIVLARTQVTAYSANGQKMSGTPVTGNEWECLPDDKKCILMQDGKPIEAFIVRKTGSKVFKFGETEVSAEMPRQDVTGVKQSMPEALDQVNVTIRGETRQILVFEDMSSLKQLQATGLNSGTWVGINPKPSKPMAVYAIRKDSIDTVGNVAKQQQQA